MCITKQIACYRKIISNSLEITSESKLNRNSNLKTDNFYMYSDLKYLFLLSICYLTYRFINFCEMKYIHRKMCILYKLKHS